MYREIAAALVAVVALALTLPDYPHRWLTLATLWLALVLSLAALKSDDSREVVLRPGKGAYAALVCLLLALALVPVEDKVTSLVAPWGNLGPTYWGRLLPVTLVTTLTPGYALLWGRVTELWEKVTLSIMLSILITGVSGYLLLCACLGTRVLLKIVIVVTNLITLAYVILKGRARDEVRVDVREGLASLGVLTFAATLMVSISGEYYQLPPYDDWFRHGQVISSYCGFRIPRLYPWLLLTHLTVYTAVLGAPSFNAYRSMFWLSALPILAMLSLAHKVLGPRKAPLAALLGYSGGLGWLYSSYLYLKGQGFVEAWRFVHPGNAAPALYLLPWPAPAIVCGSAGLMAMISLTLDHRMEPGVRDRLLSLIMVYTFLGHVLESVIFHAYSVLKGDKRARYRAILLTVIALTLEGAGLHASGKLLPLYYYLGLLSIWGLTIAVPVLKALDRRLEMNLKALRWAIVLLYPTFLALWIIDLLNGVLVKWWYGRPLFAAFPYFIIVPPSYIPAVTGPLGALSLAAALTTSEARKILSDLWPLLVVPLTAAFALPPLVGFVSLRLVNLSWPVLILLSSTLVGRRVRGVLLVLLLILGLGATLHYIAFYNLHYHTQYRLTPEDVEALRILLKEAPARVACFSLESCKKLMIVGAEAVRVRASAPLLPELRSRNITHVFISWSDRGRLGAVVIKDLARLRILYRGGDTALYAVKALTPGRAVAPRPPAASTMTQRSLGCVRWRPSP